MIKNAIQQQYNAWERLGAARVREGFVLRNGREHRAAPCKLPRATPRECFRNATLLGVERGYRYVEGFAYRATIGVLIHHAWNLSALGDVIDTTWQEPEACHYFGVEFEPFEAATQCTRAGFYGLLDGRNIKWLIERDPLVRSDLPKELADAF